MLRAGSVKVGSHLASPVLPEARGGILLHASLPPIHPIVTVTVPLAEISAPNNQPVFSPRSVCSASRPGGCWRGWWGLSEPRLLRSIPPLASPSIWPAGSLVLVVPWGRGQPGSGWASCQVSGVPWPLSAPPPRSLSSKASQFSQTAPLCSSHVTIEGICF